MDAPPTMPNSSNSSGGSSGKLASRFKAGNRIQMPTAPLPPPSVNLDDKFTYKDSTGKEFIITALGLQKIRELGRGAYGVVDEMIHSESGKIFAVKRIDTSINDESQKRMLIELNTCMNSGCCQQMVTFYGAMFRESNVWICMEVMDMSLDKFYKKCVQISIPIPEPFIAKVALALVDGLRFMRAQMNLIHRDVKPSNVLLNRKGDIKICDFGISGHLTNSVARTINAGCKPYMAPERVDGESKASYGVRADVWSVGITLVEIAMGAHPYDKWKTPFEQLKQVVTEPPPKIDPAKGYSTQLHDFVSKCLTKDFHDRPKYDALVEHPFLIQARGDTSFNTGEFITSVLDKAIEQEQQKAVAK